MITNEKRHYLVTGRTMSGKTCWAVHQMLQAYEEGWNCAYIDRTKSVEGWLEKLTEIKRGGGFLRQYFGPYRGMKLRGKYKKRETRLLIDEAHLMNQRRLVEFVTTCRHENIYTTLVTQRPKNVLPGVRTQVDHHVCFRQSADDLAELSRDSANDLRGAATLHTGEYLYTGVRGLEFFVGQGNLWG